MFRGFQVTFQICQRRYLLSSIGRFFNKLIQVYGDFGRFAAVIQYRRAVAVLVVVVVEEIECLPEFRNHWMIGGNGALPRDAGFFNGSAGLLFLVFAQFDQFGKFFGERYQLRMIFGQTCMVNTLQH